MEPSSPHVRMWEFQAVAPKANWRELCANSWHEEGAPHSAVILWFSNMKVQHTTWRTCHPPTPWPLFSHPKGLNKMVGNKSKTSWPTFKEVWVCQHPFIVLISVASVLLLCGLTSQDYSARAGLLRGKKLIQQTIRLLVNSEARYSVLKRGGALCQLLP